MAILVRASQKYREGAAAVQSELKAPRKIILWVIGLQAVEISLLAYLVFR